MTAVVILNIVLVAFVLVGMLSLLVGAIAADRREHGARPRLERRILAVRPTFRAPAARSVRRVDSAT